MYSKPHGHTYLDIFTALAIIAAVVVFIIFFTNPFMQLKKQYDAVREEGVRDITELVLELQQDDPTRFSELLQQLSSQKRMIGTAEACSGSYGVQCMDEDLSDTCLDLSTHVSLGQEPLPVDKKAGFSSERTGYALSYDGIRLSVSACMPSARDTIEIISVIQ